MFAILFAFTGQAFSATMMPCEMTLADHHAMVNMTTDTMSHDKMGTSNTMDCCDTDCTCPPNACSSFVFLNPYFPSQMISISHGSIVEPRPKHPVASISSLYRPPIFA
jgi:hypothetical protein